MTPAKRRALDRQFQPIVGFDIPILLTFIQRDIGPLERLRWVAATSLRDLASDLYLGIQLYPLTTGPAGGGFPLQISAGLRAGFESEGSGFVALHYNAAGALSTVLGAFAK